MSKQIYLSLTWDKEHKHVESAAFKEEDAHIYIPMLTHAFMSMNYEVAAANFNGEDVAFTIEVFEGAPRVVVGLSSKYQIEILSFLHAYLTFMDLKHRLGLESQMIRQMQQQMMKKSNIVVPKGTMPDLNKFKK